MSAYLLIIDLVAQRFDPSLLAPDVCCSPRKSPPAMEGPCGPFCMKETAHGCR
jgi:hypothetical protein